MRKNKPIILLLGIVLMFWSCQNSTDPSTKVAEKPESKLGEIEFTVTGSETALPHFKKGLLLLHSFEYDDARESFLKAQELDSTFAMAYWGEAMTYNHSLWQKQEIEKATAALEKLAPDKASRLAMVKTPLEKDFFEAVEILFGEGKKYERDLAYRDYLKTLTTKYPEHHEVQAFYAISLLGSARNGRDEELFDESARIAQGIIEENPGHPGALHYLIHSYDDPGHAHLAKSAADNYSKVAPDAAHALHMPSHIYVALGKWDDVVASNIASWNASIKRLNRKQIEDKNGSYHAYHWLQYGFLQRGEFEKAEEILNNMVRFTEENPDKNARGYLVRMKGAQMVETNTWEGPIAEIEVKTADLPLLRRMENAYLEGMKFAKAENLDSLKKVIAVAKQDRLESKELVGEKGFAMCSAGGYANKPPDELEINMAHVIEMELEAVLSQLEGQSVKVREIYETAVQLDEGLNYSFGPPSIFKPVHEAYGEWLLSQKKYEEAIEVFERALKRQPRRLLSLLGLKAAAAAVQQKEIVEKMEQEIALSREKMEWGEVL